MKKVLSKVLYHTLMVLLLTLMYTFFVFYGLYAIIKKTYQKVMSWINIRSTLKNDRGSKL